MFSVIDITGVTGRTVHALDVRGTVRDWFTTQAWSAPCTDLDAVLQPDGEPWGDDGRWVLTNAPDVAPLKERLYARHPLPDQPPAGEVVEGGDVRWTGPHGTVAGTWQRVHTDDDGLVDYSHFCDTAQYRVALAATVLEVDQAEWRVLRIGCTGPFAVWVGGRLAGRHGGFAYMEPLEVAVGHRLRSGPTPVVIATWQVGFREVRQVLRLRISGLPVRVVLPSEGADEYASALAEQALAEVRTERWAVDGSRAVLLGPDGLALRVDAGAGPRRVVLTSGRADVPLQRPDEDDQPAPTVLWSPERTLAFRIDDPRCPVERRLRVARLPRRRGHEHGLVEDDAPTWRRELLEYAATAEPGSTATELARWALAPEEYRLDPANLADALTALRERQDCADFEIIGLLNLWHRLPVSAWPGDLREEVRAALLRMKYWIDQPGLDAMCFFTENHQLVWHAAELLTGEAFPNETFANTGWPGWQHTKHGTSFAVEWMRRKLAGGFSEFDSNTYLAINTLTLVSLVEFAADEGVRERAEALQDLVFLLLATNSWHGVHGVAHGRAYVASLRSSRFEATAPLMWLAWGTGALNDALLPATVLATARRYRVPPLVRELGQHTPPQWYGRQVSRGEYRLKHDLLSRPYASDLRVWKTPDALLASVQDYRTGLPGLQEHVWGATLGPEVQVFATHPANSSTAGTTRPNAWAGHRILPRVRQHRDTLLVLHLLPGDDPTGGTHLWFPTPWFDEWRSVGPWLAGRVRDGYVAVATAGGAAPVTRGEVAYQEFRPRGGGRAFVCTVGRRATHGSFARFVEALGTPDFGADSVAYETIDGHRLELSWDGPFTVDGRLVDLTDDGRPETPPRLDNPVCRLAFGADRLHARLDGTELVLDLAAGRRISATG